MKIKISNKWIGNEQRAFIIAEGGINHNGKVSIAKKIILAAKDAGADAIKFQTFTAEDLTSIHSKYYKLFKKLELSIQDFDELSSFAKKQKIIFLSTPFSNNAVDQLSKINMVAYKIASGDLTDLPLIKYAAKKNKPMILSTGMATIKDIKEAIKSIVHINKKIILLHSSSAYPTPYNQTNLTAIHTLKKQFPYPVGYSDNGDDMDVPLIAVASGAKIIEKHFTYNKKLWGPDQKLSASPTELRNMIKKIRKIEEMLGDGIKKCQPSEVENLIHVRRSLTAKQHIKKGTKISEENLVIKRPALGIAPKFFDQILGMIAIKDIKQDQSIEWKDVR